LQLIQFVAKGPLQVAHVASHTANTTTTNKQTNKNESKATAKEKERKRRVKTQDKSFSNPLMNVAWQLDHSISIFFTCFLPGSNKKTKQNLRMHCMEELHQRPNKGTFVHTCCNTS
jgi:hypothetical protein